MLGAFVKFLQYERSVCRKLLLWISDLEFEILIIYLSKAFSNLGVDTKKGFYFRKTLWDCIVFQWPFWLTNLAIPKCWKQFHALVWHWLLKRSWNYKAISLTCLVSQTNFKNKQNFTVTFQFQVRNLMQERNPYPAIRCLNPLQWVRAPWLAYHNMGNENQQPKQAS